MHKIPELSIASENTNETIQQYADREDFYSRQAEGHSVIDNLAPSIKELTNLHIIALKHKVEPEYKYETNSLEQYDSNNTCSIDYRYVLNVLLRAETRLKLENILKPLSLNKSNITNYTQKLYAQKY
ncbi:hypothetical protein Zmor_016386 [Zophobas morio]|jgi:hypothetical protein|uniref:Uncharacterized protein n=1 Tax=Zophobas morio TaxID=2755281 RepID=A0AA38HGU7_9CUCU|nr:hypothetical protein Zmor_016386 [Zophobas morio]